MFNLVEYYVTNSEYRLTNYSLCKELAELLSNYWKTHYGSDLYNWEVTFPANAKFTIWLSKAISEVTADVDTAAYKQEIIRNSLSPIVVKWLADMLKIDSRRIGVDFELKKDGSSRLECRFYNL